MLVIILVTCSQIIILLFILLWLLQILLGILQYAATPPPHGHWIPFLSRLCLFQTLTPLLKFHKYSPALTYFTGLVGVLVGITMCQLICWSQNLCRILNIYLQGLLSKYPLGAADAQWKMGGGYFLMRVFTKIYDSLRLLSCCVLYLQ